MSEKIHIYFGDRSDPFYPGTYHESNQEFENIRERMGAKTITFLRQEHGTTVHLIDERSWAIEVAQRSGDALVTNRTGYAIGIVTADCLPIVLHDEEGGAIAVAHAGWRGSVQDIAGQTVARMKESFGTKPESLVAYLGPSALSCCYEVQEDFCHGHECRGHVCRGHECPQNFLHKREYQIFFDNVSLNISQLLASGLLKKHINTQHSCCTICNSSYHSFRREGRAGGWQATVAVLSDST